MILKQAKIVEHLFTMSNYFHASLSKLIVNNLRKGTAVGDLPNKIQLLLKLQ
jgi:hypothetical protein